MIQPTVGRVVWFYPGADSSGQAFPALVNFVHSDRCINVAGFNHGGTPFSHSSCQLVQEGDAEPLGAHARWMPYQVGQAKKDAIVPVTLSDAQVETLVVAAGKTAERVTPEDIEAVIAGEAFFTGEQGVVGAAVAGERTDPIPLSLRQLTICVLVLQNGYTVTGESACVNPENFDAAIGRTVARARAVEKIWSLLGYALKQRQHESSLPMHHPV